MLQESVKITCYNTKADTKIWNTVGEAANDETGTHHNATNNNNLSA